MRKGLKALMDCADLRDGGARRVHEWQVLYTPGASDITNDDNHELPAMRIT